MYKFRMVTLAIFATTFLSVGSKADAATLIGPSGGSGLSGEYAQASDSPFAALDFSGGYFYLEDFEDGLQNTLGVSADTGGVTSVVFGPTAHDSVDLDDGTLDGGSLLGDSYFSQSGAGGVTWTFSAATLGGLPTHAGVVWTDGLGSITFEAFDQNGLSLGQVLGNHANGSFFGQTDEDHFYGAIHSGGISAIKLSSASLGIEMDHLQYGKQSIIAAVPVPAGIWLALSGIASLTIASRSRRRRMESSA